MNDRFKPLLRANRVDHPRQMIGIDGLTITPAHIHGMAYVYVIKVFATGNIPNTVAYSRRCMQVPIYILLRLRALRYLNQLSRM